MKNKTIGLKALILSASFSLILTACGGGETVKESASLKGTDWQLVSINGSKPIGNRPITLYFDNGIRLSGNSGCNRYGARTYPDGKHLKLDFSGKGDDETKTAIFSTKMYCPSPRGLMDQEATYLEQLRASRRYSVSGDVLTIKDGANALVYKRVE